jgi:hypothetical protein
MTQSGFRTLCFVDGFAADFASVRFGEDSTMTPLGALRGGFLEIQRFLSVYPGSANGGHSGRLVMTFREASQLLGYQCTIDNIRRAWTKWQRRAVWASAKWR